MEGKKEIIKMKAQINEIENTNTLAITIWGNSWFTERFIKLMKPA